MSRRQTIRLPITPVPASRPRVGKWGTYYSGKYKDFMDEAERIVASVLSGIEPAPAGQALEVWVVVALPRPRTNDDKYPIRRTSGDIDNHAKSVLDAFNPDEGARAKRKAGRGWDLSAGLWADDCIIQTLHISKIWAPEGNSGYVEIAVKEKK